MRGRPEHRGRRGTGGKCLPEGPVEDDGCQPAFPRVGNNRHESRRKLGAIALGSLPQRRIVGLRKQAGGLHQAGVDLRLRQDPLGCRQDRVAQMVDVVREVEVEEGGLELFELCGRRQYIIGQPCCLAHRHVNDDEQVQRFQRLRHA